MLVLLSTLILSPLASDGGIGSGGTCPNVRACDVAATFEEQGTPRTCGVGLTLFGLELSLGGDKCYPVRLSYPAHQECHGKPNTGTWCAFEQLLGVNVEHCECSRAAVLGTGIALPDCVCTPGGTLGTIQDFQTRNCDTPPVLGGGTGTGGGS